ncbi:membrane protein import inner membrane translocase subunit tim44 [Paenibacillus polymyxa]|nr:membrane protein import inner membrane translocase subunit tim44 [Paenibacillus polymyxa]
MMLGGLAGMLFGGLFGNMGALGSLLGLVVNVLAIYVLIMVGVGIYRAIKNRRRPDDSRGGRY